MLKLAFLARFFLSGKFITKNNRKVDDKQQSLLDQPQDTPAKSRKTQKPLNNDN